MTRSLAGVGTIAAAVAVLLAASASGGSVAQQTLDVSLTPAKKLPRKNFVAARLQVDLITAVNDEDPSSNQPPSGLRTQLDYPSNIRFDHDAVPECRVEIEQLANTTPAGAVELCGRRSKVSIDSGSSSQVEVGSAAGAIELNGDVTVFNGRGKNTVFFHVRTNAANNTTVFTGKLRNGPPGFSKSLDIAIPELAAGAVSEFHTLIESGRYVQARCRTRSATYRARSTYENHAPTVATATTSCTRRT